VSAILESTACARVGVVAGSFLIDSTSVPDVTIEELGYSGQVYSPIISFSEDYLANGAVPKAAVAQRVAVTVRCLRFVSIALLHCFHGYPPSG